MKRSGKRRSSAMASALRRTKPASQHRIAHLGVVLQRHLRDGLGVGPPLALELRKQRRPVAAGGQQLIERRAVLERRVHALAVKRHDGVRGIAEQQHAPADVPGRGVHGAELALGMRGELRGQVGQQRQRIGKLALEERVTACGPSRAAKLRAPWRGRNSVAVKLPSVLGSAISMKPPRGQMCSAWRSSAPAVARRHGELLVVVIQPLLAGRHAADRGEAGAQHRAGAVGGDRGREGRLAHPAARLVTEVQPVVLQVGAEAGVVEAHADAGVARRLLDEHAVEIGAARPSR